MTSHDAMRPFPESPVAYSDEIKARSREASWAEAEDPAVVESGDWKESDELLLTTGVVSCIAVAAFNSITRRGVLGHFSAITPATLDNPLMYSDREVHKGAVRAIQKLGPIAFTRVWLGGGDAYDYNPEMADSGAPPDEYGTGVLADRASAVDSIRSIGINPSNICERWEENRRGGIDIELDCRAGILTVVNEPSRSSTQCDLDW